MKISYNWLSEYLKLDSFTHEELFEKISFHITEIEEYKKQVEATNLEIGFVKECVKHPNSDHLSICQVELATKVAQIVCGAPNVKSGIKVIVAKPGAALPGDFKIKEAKVRGEVSNGMLCSLQELGIEEKYIEKEFKDGIYILGDDAVVGTCPLEYLKLNDYIINLELTSNRSDLLSVEGFAFDLGAVLNQKVILDEIKIKEDFKNEINVKIATKNCPKYLTRVLKNVKVQDSPIWLKQKLIASGIRPINNVVDITNYVMIQVGQPLHAFDFDKLSKDITVRQAKENEEAITLDEIKRALSTDDIVITSNDEIVAIAGVMGCLNSQITSDTTNIVLEAAYFEGSSVRKTATKLGLRSESSTRFERKTDINKLNKALDLAANMIANLTNANISDISFVDHAKGIDKKVSITLDKINAVIGKSLSLNEVVDIFNRLQYAFKQDNESFEITLPSRRTDLEENYQDIIEDVVRIYGYNNIEGNLPKSNYFGQPNVKQLRQKYLRKILSHFGLNETISYSLLSEKEVHDFTLTKEKPVKILMPLSEDKNTMRLSLINGLLEAIKYNKSRKINDLGFFELGKKYTLGKETNLLAIAMTGAFNKSLWQHQTQVVDFYVVKGIIEKLFTPFKSRGIKMLYEKAEDINPNFHPKKTAVIKLNDTIIGLIGAIHPRYAKENNLEETYVCELDIDLILEVTTKDTRFHQFSKFPSITRDLAIVCKKDIPFEEINELIKRQAKQILTNIEVFDVYTGQNVKENEKSIAISLTFQDNTKTLEAYEVDNIIKKILEKLAQDLNATLR